ncbi:MAG: SpoIID/LytB protein [Cohnella sp.]|nr:SpoIID/LytB protein [Cohnella sp.]
MILPNLKRNYWRSMLLVLVLAVVFSGSTRMTTYAAVSVPDKIRVGLFLDVKKFQSITSAATLQSPGGLLLSWRDPQFTLPLGSTAPGETVRFAVDGYRAVVLETADLNAALTVLKKMQASSQAAFVTKLSKSGQTVYQVTEGVYPSTSSAAAALSKWTSAGVTAGIPSLSNAKVAGPWGVEAGPFASPAEASMAAEMIGNAGLDAFVALKPQNGALAYVVRVGQETDAAAASALQQGVAAVSGQNVRVPAAGEPYVVIRQDMSQSGAAGKPVSLYAIPASAGAVLRADPAGDGTIQLMERFKRSYRGSMEMSVLGNALAVVNEVNFEQYLYSVVGAEVGSGWPPEAQKAQAVAARSYALASGVGFQIANVVDTTLSQAYSGTASENANSTAGVNATAGEVLTSEGKVISAVFSSNAGGITADNATEVWGSNLPYLSGGVTSPDDGPQAGKPDWYDVALDSGQRGYIRSDLLGEAAPNGAGVKQMSVAVEGATLRTRPDINSQSIVLLSAGTTVVPLAKVPQYTDYSWVEEPAEPDKLLISLNKLFQLNGPIQTVEVTGRGPSGRVTQLTVNGTPLLLKSPDSWRTALGSVKSTLISIEETARMTVAGAGGQTREFPQQAGSMQLMGAGGQTRSLDGGNLFVMDAAGQTRVVTSNPTFIISGKGFGHGLGMSQYGAKKLAEQGNDYTAILKYYYKNVVLEKGAPG